MSEFTYQQIATMIDHSLLRPEMTWEELEIGVDVALKYRVASVCALPFYVPRLTERLAGSGVKTSTTVGFPHGATTTRTKVFETRDAVASGCEEVDFVVNLSRVKSGQWDLVRDEIRAIIDACHEQGARAKVIFETCFLDDEEKLRLCEISSEAGADWVKTSTGFGTGGATEHDVELLRRHCPSTVEVKASGGIRTLETLLSFRSLGASRVGSSATSQILDACRAVLD